MLFLVQLRRYPVSDHCLNCHHISFGLLLLRTNPINQGLRHCGEYRGRSLCKAPRSSNPSSTPLLIPTPSKAHHIYLVPLPPPQYLRILPLCLQSFHVMGWLLINPSVVIFKTIIGEQWPYSLEPAPPLPLSPSSSPTTVVSFSVSRQRIHGRDSNKEVLISQPKLQEPGI